MGFVVHILCKMPARRAAAVAGLEPGGGGARAWLEHRCDRDPHNPQALRPSSLKDYPLLLSNHILPGLGSIRLSELTPSHIEAWYWKLGARRIPRARAKA